MVILRPKGLKPAPYKRVEPTDGVCPQFVIHPSTSELAEQLVIDPEALKNENYPGIYDENGDYVPMFCDDPEKIPQGADLSNKPTGAQPPAEPPASVGPQEPPTSPEPSKSE